MSAGSAFSSETLFAQMVAHRLSNIVSQCQMTGVDDSDAYWSWSDDAHLWKDARASSDNYDRVIVRLDSMESAVKSLEVKLDTILSRLPAVPVISPAISPVRYARHRAVAAPILGGVRKNARSTRESESEEISSSSLEASPGRHQFVCPLCLKPQFTPKSHCEHLKNSASDGVHVCRFVVEHSRHAQILKLFGSADHFVQWYVTLFQLLILCNLMLPRYCSFLRSGVGKQYTIADIQDYIQLHVLLNEILTQNLVVPLRLQ